jgi:predicted nucleic acid-binding protein
LSRLFDSTVLIAHLCGEQRATELLLDAADDGALATVISRAKIEGGIALWRAPRREPTLRRCAPPAGDRCDRPPRRTRPAALRRSHPGIDLIAATAEDEAATLVTLDVKHFPMIEGLRAPW